LAGAEVPLDDSPEPDPALPPTPLDDAVELPLLPALALLEVDQLGLDRLDREILRVICEKFAGGPVGLSTLSVAVGEERDTIEDVYEPYLLQLGMIKRTPRGRSATSHAYTHLGLDLPATSPALF